MEKIRLFFALFISAIIIALTGLMWADTVQAQIQTDPFSGSNKDSYQCFSPTGQSLPVSDVRIGLNQDGYWLCNCNDGSSPLANGRCRGGVCGRGDRPGDPGCIAQQAVLKPPTLQQVEIWFVRILYVVWALVGGLSFFFLVVLGYRYMITRGDVTKITEIRQKIIYYIIGFVLVFLAVPILTTVFRVLGINNQVQCYNVDMPGFQFVFTDLCTSPRADADPCSIEQGQACADEGRTLTCSPTAYRCTNGIWTRIF